MIFTTDDIKNVHLFLSALNNKLLEVERAQYKLQVLLHHVDKKLPKSHDFHHKINEMDKKLNHIIKTLGEKNERN